MDPSEATRGGAGGSRQEASGTPMWAAGGEIQAPEIALEANKKRLELAYTVAGARSKGRANVGSEPAPDDGGRKSLSDAVKEYLADCKRPPGKVRLRPRCPHPERLRIPPRLPERIRPEAYLDEIDADFRQEIPPLPPRARQDLGDRTSYNILQGREHIPHQKWQRRGQPILKEMSFPPTEVIDPYSNVRHENSSSPPARVGGTIFKFFLHSMARD